MKKNANTIQDEIDAIRIALYEETKHMTPEEFNDYVRTQTAPIIEKFGLKLISSINDINDA
jgi:hypothetical protein